MKTIIRPETEMKDSGIEWVGVIPKEWSSIKGKYVYFVQAGYPFNSEHFSLIKGMPLIRIRDITSGKCETYFDGDYSDEYVVNNTDLLIGMDGDFNVRWWESGQAVLNQRCCRILEKNNISRKYLYYALPFSLKELNDLTYFTTVKHLSNNGILNLNFPFPPLSEQQAIADYLDETCSKIDEIIAEAKASIDEYKELKQSVIFEAVTKGLDKNVEMKDSGIEWIGEIPVGWVVKKFKYVAIVNTNLVSPIGYEDYHQIAPDCIEKDSGRIIKERTVSEAGIESWNQLFKQGQLIYSKIRPTLNKVIIAPYDGLCSADMYPLDVHENIYFVQFAMLSKYFVGQVSLITQDRVKMPKINQDELSNVYVAVPEKTEQKKIVDWLNVQLPKYDSLIAEKESLINDLEAYKKSLIYEVVTGKRRVV